MVMAELEDDITTSKMVMVIEISLTEGAILSCLMQMTNTMFQMQKVWPL